MKLAISNIAWPSEKDTDAARLMEESGCRGLEIAPTMVWPQPLEISAAELTAYREGWHARGVTILGLQALLYGKPDLTLFGDQSTRERLAGRLIAMARIASGLGARVLVFGSPGNRRRGGLPMEEAMDSAETFLRGVAPALSDLGTCLAIEANPTAYGCDFLTATAEAAELVRRVDHEGVRLQLDTSTMALNGEDYGLEIRNGLPLACHVHASEPHLAPFGSGRTDHGAAAAALRAADYEGWVSVEMRMVPDDAALAAVATALRQARAHYIAT